MALTSLDQNLKHNHIQIVALLKSNTHSFLLTSGSFSGPQMVKAFVTTLPDMKGIIATMPAPVVCKVWLTGEVRVTYTHEGLIDRVLDAQQRYLARAASEARRRTQS
jgi:hypothetical protein